MNPIYEQFSREQEEQKKYADARKDLLKAAESFNKLTPQQKEQLLNELYNIAVCFQLADRYQTHNR